MFLLGGFASPKGKSYFAQFSGLKNQATKLHDLFLSSTYFKFPGTYNNIFTHTY